MAITAAELNVLVTAETKGAETAFSGFQARLKRFGDELQGVGARMSIGITAPLALMGAAIIKVGTDYEKAMNLFQVNAQATSAEMARASQVAKQLGADMMLPATSAGDVALAMNELAKGGLTATEAMEAVRGTLQLAAAAQISEADAALLTATALNVFGLEAAESARVTDLLAAAANASLAEIGDVGLAMQQAANVFAASKVSIEDLTTSIAIMAQAGIRGSDAGTSLKTMMLALQAPTDKAAAVMKQLGINIFDAQGQFIPFRGMIEQVSTALEGMTEQQQAMALKTIFGTDAIRAANAVMAKGTDAFDEMSKAVNRAGVAQEVSAARAKGLSGAIDGLVSQLESLAIEIYESVSPGLESMTRMLADLVGNLAQADKAVLQAGVVMAGVFAAAGPIALGIGVIVSLIGGPLTIAIVGLTAAVAILAAEWVLDMNKMGQAGAITAETTRDKFIELATTIGHVMDGLSFATNLVAAAIKDVAAIVFAALTPVIYLGLAITEGFSKAATIIKDTWSNLNASIARSNDAMSSALEGRWSTMLGNLVRGMSAAGQSIQRAWGETAASFGARSKIKWDTALTPDGDAQKKIKDAMRNVGNGAAAAFGEGTKGGGKKAIDAFANEVKEAMKAVTQAIEDGLLGGDKIGRILADKIIPAVDTLKKKAAELATTIRAVGDAFNREMGTAIDSVTEKVIRGDGTFEALINRMIDLKRASETAARASKEEFEALSDTFKDLSSNLPRAWNTIIDGILQGSGRLGTDLLKLGVKVKGYANDIINVFDTLPGKWGQSLNRAMDEVNKWINFIDSALKLVQRLIGSAQTGLAGVFENVAGSLNRSTDLMSMSHEQIGLTAKQASQGLDELSTQLQKSGDEAGQTAGKWVAAVAGVAAGISMFVGTRHQGLATGIFGGALGGFTAGAAIGSVIPGLGTLIGGAIGGLIGAIGGLFGTGKSEAQKKAEADAAKAAQMNGQQVGANIINTYLDGVSKALDLAPKMAEFEGVSNSQIKAVFKFMTRVVNRFLDQAKIWSTENLTQAKQVAETIGPIFEVMTAIPNLETAINSSFGVAESQIDVMFATLDRIVDRWSARAEEWGASQFKKIKKIAERMAPAINLFVPLIEAIKATSTASEIDDAQLGVIDRSLDKIIKTIGGLAEKFEKPFLKALENFASKVQPALALWKDQVELLKSTVDVPILKESDADNVVSGMKLFLEKLLAGFSTFNTEGLGRLLAILGAVSPVATALQAWLETSALAREYTALGAEMWDALAEDFTHALDVLMGMATRAVVFEQTAKSFESYIASGAASLAHAFEMLSQIMNAAGSFFPSGTPATTASVPALASGGDIQSSGLAFLHAGERVVPASVVSGSQGAGAINLTVNVNAGTLVHQSSIPDFIVRGLIEAYKQGRISNSVFTGNLVTR